MRLLELTQSSRFLKKPLNKRLIPSSIIILPPAIAIFVTITKTIAFIIIAN